MTAEEIIDTIATHNLCVRRLPEVVVSRFTAGAIKEGDTVVEIKGRKYIEQTRTPKNAGWYMCTQVNNTDSLVRFSKKDHLAPTLAESLGLFLKTRELAGA